MASSLSQQLSQVRSHNAAQLGNAKSAAKVQSASYLFPPQVASLQDFQTLQALGENGWDELSAYDTVFSKWDQATGAGEVLFGESSRGLDRLMKTKEENRSLDSTIAEFFSLSGGNLLDRSTGKCIEWLVRRFRVHEYNVEMVLSAFMPYHETQEFARMLQLLNLQDKPHFAFLLPVQKRATPLPSSVLISTLLGPPSTTASLTTLRWVINLLSPRNVTRFRRPNYPLQSFWLSTVIKFCARVQAGGTERRAGANREDDHQLYLSVLLPAALDAALTTQLGPDCQIAGCLAICAIAASFDLSIEARQSICSSLISAKMDVERMREAYLTSLACLCKGVDDDNIWKADETPLIMTPSTALQLARRPSIASSLKKLSQSYDIQGFLLNLSAALLMPSDAFEEEDGKKAIKFIEELLLYDDTLPDGIAAKIIGKANGSLTQRQEWGQLVDMLRQRRPGIIIVTGETVPSTVQEAAGRSATSKASSLKASGVTQSQQIQETASQVDVSLSNGITAISLTDDGPAAIYQQAVLLSLERDKDGPSSQILTTLFSRLGDASLALLASVWTTSSTSTEVRLAALSHAHAFLSAFTAKDAKVRLVDFQTIIPSLLLALKDGEAVIRFEALQCFERISLITATIEASNSKETRVEIYGFDTIYGPQHSDALKYLDNADVGRLTKSLLQDQASFEHDATYVHMWLQNNLGAGRGQGKKEIAYKKRVVEVLSSHALCWTNVEARIGLLDAMAGVADVTKLEVLLPLLREVIEGHMPVGLNKELLDAYVGLLFGAYDSSTRGAIDANESGSWTLVLTALEEGNFMVQKQAARSLKRTIFDLLSDSKKKEVFARLANLLANSMTTLPAELRSCLLDLKMDSSSVVPILHDLRGVVSSHALKTIQHKKAKGPAAAPDDETWTRAMAVIIEILEALLSRRSVPSSDYITELFENVRLGTELLLSGQANSEYLVQVSMSNLRACLDVLRKSGKQQVISSDILSSLRVDTVVNVIKTSCKPQTFQQALLLLSVLGSITPEVVLHNVMPIFTFVGSTMLQRDDDYSFVVVEKTLQSILPPAIKDMASKATGKGELALLQSSRNLLCVFTDAAKHVPRHRRVSFFYTLVNVIGTDYLAAICMLLIDRSASKVSKQSSKEDVKTTLQLPLSLFKRSDGNPVRLWNALNKVWDEVERNWTHRAEDALELQEHVFLDCVGTLGLEHEGERRAGPLKRITALTCFIDLAVAANDDALEEYSLQMEESADRQEQEGVMWKFINHALSMSQISNTSISVLAQSALESVMRIVPANILFSVTINLLHSDKVQDKQSGLHLCTKSLSSMADEDREKATTSIAEIIKECYRLIDKERELAGTALDTLLAIAQDCTASEHASLSSGLAQLIVLAQSDSDALQERALTLLNSLSRHLGPRLIPHLASLITPTLQLLASDTAATKTKSLVLELLSGLVRAIPIFVASYIDGIIRLFVQMPSLLEMKQSSALTSSIVRFIPSLQLLDTIFAVWEEGDKMSLPLHTVCLDLLERTIKTSDKKSIMSSYKNIFRQITTIFDVRRQSVVKPAAWTLSPADLATVEDKTVSVFLRLVLKLNEGAFRPLFLRFCDWAMLDLASEDDESSSGDSFEIIARKIVLFKVVNALLAELGELVINYYLNILDGAIDSLTGFEKAQLDSHELWTQVILSLKQSARADKGRGSFWNENRVKAVIPGMVAQVPTVMVKNNVSHESLLGDATAAICQAVPDEPCLKMTNNLLLECTRSSQVKVKISAIRILVKIWKSEECEDSLLRLVPETVPSIAELLQESEAAVQDDLGAFVSAVEKVLGEGLESYLQ